jgi:hypothetical protein
MKALQFGCIALAITVAGTALTFLEVTRNDARRAAAEAEAGADPQGSIVPSATGSLTPSATSISRSAREPRLSFAVTAAINATEAELARLREDFAAFANHLPHPTPPKQDLSYLVYYVYSELPPERKPAEIVLDSLSNIPIGTPVEEIKHASDAFGLDFNFMKAVAKIESGFDPKQRTGSYMGLFQLSNYEFAKYGSGDIMSPRDNAVAAAYKFITEAVQFEWATHKKPTFSDLYLIHQQGWQGAAEHVSHPERIAWQSMCATDEGKEKGEKWCKKAIWRNTLPAVKQAWKTVDKLTSGAFVTMWQQRVDLFYSRYSEAAVAVSKQ